MTDFEYPAGAKAAGSPDISHVSGLTDDECQELILNTVPFGSNAVDEAELNDITFGTARMLWPSIGRIQNRPGQRRGIDVFVIHTGNN